MKQFLLSNHHQLMTTPSTIILDQAQNRLPELINDPFLMEHQHMTSLGCMCPCLTAIMMALYTSELSTNN